MQRVYFTCQVAQLDTAQTQTVVLHKFLFFHYNTPVAAQVLSVSEHTICGSKLQLKYVTIPDPKESGEQYDSNKLLIHQIPQDIDEDYLQLFLEGTLKMDSQDQFVVEVRGESAMITFLNAQFSYEGM